MTTAMYVLVVCGRPHAQLVEEDGRHICVKVLPGVHYRLVQSSRGMDSVRHNARLDELWAGAEDGDDFFHV